MTAPKKTTRKKPELAPVKFTPIFRVVKPQIRVRFLRDVNGWIDRGKKSGKPSKWTVSAGAIGMIDEERAREYQAKGYLEVLDGELKPVSADELAQWQSEMTTIGL